MCVYLCLYVYACVFVCACIDIFLCVRVFLKVRFSHALKINCVLFKFPIKVYIVT